MTLTAAHMIAAALTLLIIMAVGVWSGRKVASAEDFDTGGRSAGTIMVAGTTIGTLVGGSSTIGTAELAFTCGLSAWWFTLGAAMGALLLALPYCHPLRATKAETLQEIIGMEYGDGARVASSVLASLGIALNIVAQMLSANALLGAIFGLDGRLCAVIAVVVMGCYIMFGGVRGSGILGLIKLVLLYGAVLVGGFAALRLAGGLGGLTAALPHAQYFSLFSRGVGKDLGAGASVALGVVSTQTYMQSVRVARDDRTARRGTLLSAALIPPIGLLCIFVGDYMRVAFPEMDASQALPRFLVAQTPPVLCGVFLAALLIAIVGTGSGMAMGFGKILTHDIYARYIRPQANSREQLFATRVIIFVSLVVSGWVAAGGLGSTILTWGFLSMGLRAVVLLLPVSTALFLPGRMQSGFAIASSAVGLAVMLAARLIDLPCDSLFAGLAASATVIAIGLLHGKKA